MSTENNEPVTVTTGDYYAEDDQNTVGEKHGKILGGLCDATIIANGANVFIIFTLTILSVFDIVPRHAFSHHFDPDIEQRYASWLPIFMTIFAVGISYNAIEGAREYCKWKILVALAWYVLSAILSLRGLDFIGLIVSSLFAYTHFEFYQEIKKGIMSEENYPREDFTLCCV